MDSISNLPLLEIAGEDDSLLFNVSAASTDVFSCSPLLSLRSNPPQSGYEGREGGGGDADSETSENPSSSLGENANKENADWNKPQKLSVETQKMKRKKRGGGYNLRKSLAWDRAFFTEQGVLNAVELSMISGAATAKAGLNLEAIQEEESVNNSIELQEIEENLFMHSSDAAPVNDRKIGLSPKHGALAKASPAPVTLAKRKVLTVNDTVGNRAKRNACPRLPVASSSLKKPDMKAPNKELKRNRIPGPTLNVFATATTTRSGITSFSKSNAHPIPVTNVQKNAGVKGLSKIPKTAPSKSKVGLADKCSVSRTLAQRTWRHLDNTVSETHPPSRMHQSETEANKVSEARLPQGVSDIGEKKQQAQFQATKSSGLRMPSPSLGFFSLSQAKAPGAQSQLQKSSKLTNIETKSVIEARLPHAPGVRSKIAKGATKNCIEELSRLDVKSEASMQVDNKQMAGVEVEHNSMGSEKMAKQEKVETILEDVNIKPKEQGELHRIEKDSNVDDVVFPRHEMKLLTKSGTQEQLEKEVDHLDVFSKGYQSIFQEQQSMHYHGIQRTSIVGSITNTVHSAMGQDEDEQIKLPGYDVLTSNETSVLLERHDTSFKDRRLSEEFKEHRSVKTAFINSSLNDSSETDLGGSIQEIHFKNTEEVNGGDADFVTSGGDARVCLLDRNLPDECHETNGSNLEAVNQQLPGEQLETASTSIVGEISSKENESHVNSCQVVHIISSKCSPQKSVQEINCPAESEKKIAKIEDCQFPQIISSKCSPQKSVQEINCPAESEKKMAKIEECQFPVDGQSGFIQTRPVLEGCELVIVSKAMQDSTQAFELNRLSKDCITISATACNTEVSNVSQESRPFHENNLENLHFTSQQCPMEKYDFDSIENEMSTDNCCMISELQHRDEGSSRDASTHYDVLCEDENSVLNHGHLVDQRKFSEVSADFISNTNDSISCGAEKSSCSLQHTLLAQLVQEVDHTNRETEESHVEDAQVQSFNENTVAYNCNSKPCFVIDENSHVSDFQRTIAVGGVDSENVNSVLHLDGDWLPTSIASSEEINMSEGVLEGCDIYISEHNTSNHQIQAVPENKDRNLDVDEKEELMNNVNEGSFDILPLVEVQLNDKIISSECDSTVQVSTDSLTPVVAWKSEEHCALSERSNLPASGNLTFNTIIPQVCEISSMDSKTFSDEAEINVFDKHELSNTDVSRPSQGGIYFAQDNNIIHLKKSVTKSQQEVPTVKPPPTAASLSDQWLAATTGELNQNSPSGGGWPETSSATACDTKLSNDGFNRDASTHSNVERDVAGNFEQQDSMIIYSKANEMLYEYESLLPNCDNLVDQKEFCEVSADFISNTENSIGRGAEKPSCHLPQALLAQFVQECVQSNREIEESHLEDAQVSAAFISNSNGSIGSGAEEPSSHLQHTILAQFVQEFDYHSKEIEESHLEDAQEQSFTENPVAFNCNSKYGLAVTNDKFPLADNNNINEDSHFSEFERPSAVGEDSQNVNILHSDGDWLPTKVTFSEEIKKPNLSEGALEGRDIHSSEHNISNHHIQAMPENKDENIDVDERAVLLQMEDAKKGSDTLPVVEVQLNDQVVSSECESSVEVSKDSRTQVIARKSEEHCSLSESSNVPALDNLTINIRIPQVCVASSLNSIRPSDEFETNIFEEDGFPNSDMQLQSKDNIFSAEDISKKIHLQNSATKSKQEVPTVKPPPNVAPFSDEWLAAIEAAGEEILTIKSGAVQNSPPEKPQQEPSPWSPVRRKNQSLGPFDCTKHNIQH
ncbi:hypothetical protein Fmac_022094 [Flemingia macrophylla]|uniref:Uncharacterized protein n=1 Tax=Flemingia macrophylla TaxID=520843 RepID=A0ABD1LZ12_9FABA